MKFVRKKLPITNIGIKKDWIFKQCTIFQTVSFSGTEQVKNSEDCHEFASSIVMHDVTRDSPTRLSTSTFDVRGSLVKEFLPSSVTGKTWTCKLFILILFLPASSFLDECFNISDLSLRSFLISSILFL